MVHYRVRVKASSLSMSTARPTARRCSLWPSWGSQQTMPSFPGRPALAFEPTWLFDCSQFPARVISAATSARLGIPPFLPLCRLYLFSTVSSPILLIVQGYTGMIHLEMIRQLDDHLHDIIGLIVFLIPPFQLSFCSVLKRVREYALQHGSSYCSLSLLVSASISSMKRERNKNNLNRGSLTMILRLLYQCLPVYSFLVP